MCACATDLTVIHDRVCDDGNGDNDISYGLYKGTEKKSITQMNR